MPTNSQEETTKTTSSKKAVLAVATVLSLVALLLLGGVIYRQEVSALPCTDDRDGLLGRAGLLFDPENRGAVRFEDYDELSEVVVEIERQPNYERDINCLYVTANYYMYGDIDRAEEIRDAAKSLHADGQDISHRLAGASIERLEYIILVRKTAAEEAAQNTLHIIIDEEGLRNGSE